MGRSRMSRNSDVRSEHDGGFGLSWENSSGKSGGLVPAGLVNALPEDDRKGNDFRPNYLRL